MPTWFYLLLAFFAGVFVGSAAILWVIHLKWEDWRNDRG